MEQPELTVYREAWLQAAASFLFDHIAKQDLPCVDVRVSYVEQVGPYPHAAITVKPKGKVGSRLRLYQCRCDPPVKVRVASDGFQAVCLVCDVEFVQVSKEDE